jgi:AmmeMemoRadiSam system protein A
MESNSGNTLLSIARATISQALGSTMETPTNNAPWLQQHGASFVTLKLRQQLRGCIGTLVAHRPLGDDVKNNALAAAFRDPRFTPLVASELHTVRIEVSVLSDASAMEFVDEQDVYRKLNPHVDGVVFEYKEHRSTFLPQVWESLPDPRVFIAHLKQKAGVPVEFWSNDVKLSLYTVSKWQENI